MRISYHNTRNEYLYEVIEPPMSPLEKELTSRLHEVLIDEFEPLPEIDPATKRTRAPPHGRPQAPRVGALARARSRRDGSSTTWNGTSSATASSTRPMTDSEVEDISCDGVGIPLYIYHRKFGSIRSNLKFEDSKVLDDYVVWLAQRSGKHISVASPILDATVPDGSRLQATLGMHVTKRGSSFTIRRFRDNPFTPVDLLKFRTMSPEMMAYLWIAIENGQSMMVCGGTASGKTTTLNATLLFIPPQMKIVSIEDTRELNLPHENWVPSLTRAGFGAKNPTSGKAPGEIDMFDLLAAALRQRPQYLMVGEVRGAEAFIVFQAMATGQDLLHHLPRRERERDGPPDGEPADHAAPLARDRAQPRPPPAPGEGRHEDDAARPVAHRDRRSRPRDQRADHELGLLLEPGGRHVPLLGPLVRLRAGRAAQEPGR